MPVRYTDRAAEELLNAVLWYESVQQGLGATMLQLVEDSLERISQRPELYSLKHKHFRCCPISRFPYSVFYTVESEEIVIHAIFDNRQNPIKRP